MWYVSSNRHLLEPLLEMSAVAVVSIALLKIILIFLNGLFTKLTLRAFNKEITIGETTYISLLSSLGNYFGPLLGGTGIRAAYLKKKHGFALTHFVGTLYGYYLITFFSTSVVGLFSLLAIYLQTGNYSSTITIVFSSIVILVTALFFIKVPANKKFEKKKYIGFVYKRLSQSSAGWETLLNNKKLLRRLIFLSIIIFLSGFAAISIEFLALGIDISLPGLLLYTSLGSISMLISFTPGAIGIREAIYIFSAGVLLLNNDKILQLAAVDRGVTILVLLVSYIYLQFIKNNLPNVR